MIQPVFWQVSAKISIQQGAITATTIQRRRHGMRYLAVDIMVVVMMLVVAYGVYLRFHIG